MAGSGTFANANLGFNEDTATYGQTFTPSVTATIKSFGFLVHFPSDLQFKAYLYGWDGSKAIEPALYSSSVTIGTDKQQVITFVVPGCVILHSSTQYVIFMSSSGLWDGTYPDNGSLTFISGQNGNYNGSTVYDNNGNDTGLLTTSPWDSTSNSFSMASSISYL